MQRLPTGRPFGAIRPKPGSKTGRVEGNGDREAAVKGYAKCVLQV